MNFEATTPDMSMFACNKKECVGGLPRAAEQAASARTKEVGQKGKRSANEKTPENGTLTALTFTVSSIILSRPVE